MTTNRCRYNNKNKDANKIKQEGIEDQIGFLKSTIDFHKELIIELTEKINQLQSVCKHDFDFNKTCKYCNLNLLASTSTELSKNEYIHYAKKLKEIYINENKIDLLKELRELLEKKNLKDNSYPTIDQI